MSRPLLVFVSMYILRGGGLSFLRGGKSVDEAVMVYLPEKHPAAL